MRETDLAQLQPMADAIRQLSADSVERANSGHPGMPMGMADIATVLWARHLRFSPHHPEWISRDRFILSNGHGSLLLYSLLALTGTAGFHIDQLNTFRTLHSPFAGHPEYAPHHGIETTTGPLGQGLGNGVGVALGEQMLQARFGKEVIDHYTYVCVGDGCLMEGISHEAASLAGHLNLHKLIVLFDDNHITIDGRTNLSTSENHLKRFEAYGWAVQAIDGHDMNAIDKALVKAKASDKPTLIACRTIIGKGSPTKADSASAHGSPLGQADVEAVRAILNVSDGPFQINAPILEAWKAVAVKADTQYLEWKKTYITVPEAVRDTVEALRHPHLDATVQEALTALKARIMKEGPTKATRQSSQDVLKILVPALPTLIGGSADLTASNNTKVEGMEDIHAKDYSGRYINYGIREHAMGAVMNGLSLQPGLIPYGGTFLCFSDYMRPAIRLAALMQRQVIYVFTHDSIGLGEDGPTHQPVEHLMSLRLIPNLLVIRPADGREVVDAWEVALDYIAGPTALCLTRQSVPTLPYFGSTDMNMVSLGGYILQEGDPDGLTVIASGSEVSLALEVAALLKGARVISMPALTLFLQQPEEYRRHVIPHPELCVSIEAGSTLGWESVVGTHGLRLGLDHFGYSAPYKDIYAAVGLTAPQIVEKIHHHFKP